MIVYCRQLYVGPSFFTTPLNKASVYEKLKCDHSNESYRAVLSCGAVYYAVQGGITFESVYEKLKCDHSNESYWAVLSCGAVYFVVQGGSSLVLNCDCGNERYSLIFPMVFFVLHVLSNNLKYSYC